MTSKERVLTSMAGEEPDRVLLAEFAVDHETVSRVIGRPTFWRGHFKTTKALWEGKRDEVVSLMIVDLIEFHKKVPLDMVPIVTVPSKYKEITPYTEIAPNTFEDEEGNIYSVGESQWLLLTKPAEKDFSLNDFPEPVIEEPDESELELIHAIMNEFGDSHFILARSGDSTFPMPGGMENSMMMLVDSPEILKRAAEVGTTREIANDAMFIREGADGLCPAADYATMQGPLCSPMQIEKMFFPSMKRQTDAAHQLGAKVLKHACGNNWRLMDMLLEVGYDAYQSIQAAATMDLPRLKREVGDKITLWGGVGTELLTGGTPQEIRSEVRRSIAAAAHGGRFILGSSHSIMLGTKYENFVAMIDEAQKVGEYPIVSLAA